MALNGKEKQFNVVWVGTDSAIAIVTKTAYIPVGGELVVTGSTDAAEAILSTSRVYLNGSPVSMTAYTIGGNNYFKLRDVAFFVDFGVIWDGAANTVKIDTTTGYTA
jgi:hypothetical protein